MPISFSSMTGRGVTRHEPDLIHRNRVGHRSRGIDCAAGLLAAQYAMARGCAVAGCADHVGGTRHARAFCLQSGECRIEQGGARMRMCRNNLA